VSVLRDSFAELGPEKYKVINPCRLTNVQNLVVILPLW